MIVTRELTEKEARALTAKIRKSIDDLIPLIAEAFHGAADKALGYESWQAYCDAELHGIRVPFESRDQRRAAVIDLRKSGMSHRSIGFALGVSDTTVCVDLAATASKKAVALPERVIGLNRKRYAATGQGNRYNLEPEPEPEPEASCTVVYAEVIPTPFEWYRDKLNEYIEEIHRQHNLTYEQAIALAEVGNAMDKFVATAT